MPSSPTSPAHAFTGPGHKSEPTLLPGATVGIPSPAARRVRQVDLTSVIKPQTNADWSSYFDCLYGQLLANPAISGLTLQVHWDLVNTGPDVYNWSYVTNAFIQTSNWNVLNPNAQKNIQFIVTPGFNSPPWVLADIAAADGACDGLFTNQGASHNCGTVTFIGYNENADGNVLPLPWNETYISAFTMFCAR